jgi:hypothetical protein
MKVLAFVPVALALLLALPPVAAQDLAGAVAQSAYRTNPALAAEADQSFARAKAIFESRFTEGSVKEFRDQLNKAGVLGHEEAAYMLCTFNSNEALGIAFFREGYFWCRVAEAQSASHDAERSKRAKANLSYVSERLGRNQLHQGQEYESFMLQKRAAAAKAAGERPGDHP